MAELLAFSGSVRKASFNQRLLSHLVSAARDQGANVTEVDLGDLDIPVYNGDDEAMSGTPKGAAELRQLMIAADGLIIGCPEYNGFMTPLLLNALDWASRTEGRGNLEPFIGKTVLIACASPGGGGGTRAATHLRTMLSGIGCFVMPQPFAVPSAGNAFNDDGSFTDENMPKRVSDTVRRFIDTTDRLS